MVHKITIRNEGVDNQGLSFLQDKMITEILALRNLYEKQNGFAFDNIYMSPTVSNLLAYSPLFFHDDEFKTKISDSEINYIGSISSIRVFVDINIPRNKLKMSVDRSKIRNLKIEDIIEGTDNTKKYEIVIEIDSDLI